MKIYQNNHPRFKRARCARCHVFIEGCICSCIPNLKESLSFGILFHPEELVKPTNTGKLLKLIYPNTLEWKWDRLANWQELITGQLGGNNNRFRLVFPSEKSVPLHASIHGSEKLTFILLDGTWKQCRKMINQSVFLQSIDHVKIHLPTKSSFVLRNQSSEHHYSTFEVASRIIKELAGDNEGAKAESLFETFQFYYIQTKNFKKNLPPPLEKFQEILRDKGFSP